MKVGERSSSTQLRRAAGSQSLELLKEAVVGWTAKEIDQIAIEDDKSAIHMAAWHGCIENLQYLLELGCDINVIATGRFTYGKTALFFAATQCRNSVVEFLLRHGAFVRIVNNKGQSVISLAASHLDENIVTMIQQYEQIQSEEAWWNFRTTHSDNLEYGDLDPRFLDRPLRESDVVTTLAINPTTAESRRGAFLKRNPHVVGLVNDERQRKTSSRKRNASDQRIKLATEEQTQMDAAWDRFIKGLQNGSPEKADILAYMSFAEKEQRAWIPDAVHRLQTTDISPKFIASFLLSVDGSTREMLLLQKIAKTMDDSTLISQRHRIRNISTQLSPAKQLFSNPYWQEASSAVNGMSISSFEGTGPNLSLPNPPIWVDSPDGLDDLTTVLSTEKVLAFDTEWSSFENDAKLTVATLQIASKSGVWVIDGLQRNIKYKAKARNLIRGLFQKILIGFAVGNDVPKLEAWLDVSLTTARCLDLQLLWYGPQMPGLATCVDEFTSLRLSKEEQCSDWSHRPLRDSQLYYAGLDAAILLPLLAEKTKQVENSSK